MSFGRGRNSFLCSNLLFGRGRKVDGHPLSWKAEKSSMLPTAKKHTLFELHCAIRFRTRLSDIVEVTHKDDGTPYSEIRSQRVRPITIKNTRSGACPIDGLTFIRTCRESKIFCHLGGGGDAGGYGEIVGYDAMVG